MKQHKLLSLSTTQIIICGFLLAILIGTVLLLLPVASADGVETTILDALFTSTTSVCVTGLVTVDTFSHWSLFGHIVILLLIQLGGLGIVTFTTSLILLIGRKVTLRSRLLLEDAFNLNTLTGLVRFLKFVLATTGIIELIGMAGYAIVFVPEYGAKGIWYSLFHSVSAFCNAGIDILGPDSLASYASNMWVNIVTMLLIICGGLGFIVWMDIFRVRGLYRSGDIPRKYLYQKLNVHTKIVLWTTVILIAIGALLVYTLEYTNEGTLGNLSEPQKILSSIFESVTLRTAGFYTIPQENLRETTVLVALVFMVIGGSSVGTAGGIKTTTFALVILSMWSTILGRDEVSAFKRTIPLRTIRKALSVLLIFVIVVFTATILMTVVTGSNITDAAFETFSALGTVGLSRGFTPNMNTAGKIIIIICMYLGRIGPISLAIALGTGRSKKSMVTYLQEDITVG